MVLEKTLESPLDCKEIQPVHSEWTEEPGGLKESDTTESLSMRALLEVRVWPDAPSSAASLREGEHSLEQARQFP